MSASTESVTFIVNKEHSLGDPPSGSNGGNSGDDHAPIGYYSGNGWTWRELIRASLTFGSEPEGGWQFVDCELWLKTTSYVHVAAGGTPKVKIGRLSDSFTASGGGENSWGSSYGTVYPGPTVAGQISLPSHTKASNTIVKLDISDPFEPLVPSSMRWRSGGTSTQDTNNGFRIESNDESVGGNTTEFYSMRGSYAPRFYVRYKVGRLPGAPALTGPTGVVAVAPTTFVGVATETPVSKYAVTVSTDPTFATGILWNVSAVTAGISGATCTATYAGLTQPLGVPIYWRMHTANDMEKYGPWAEGQYTISASGSGAIPYPVADGLARISNLTEEVEWASGVAHAKPEITWRFNDAAGRQATSVNVRLYSDGSTLLHNDTFQGSFAANTDLTLATTRAVVRGTYYRIEVIPYVGAVAQTSSGLRRFRCQWGQGIFIVNPAPGAGATGHRLVNSPVTGVDARVAFLHRFRDGGVTGPWKSTPAGAGTIRTNWDILVRMGTRTGMPVLPDMTAYWTAATAKPPDNWNVYQCAMTLDEGFRRFGVKSLKVTTLAGLAGTVWPGIEPGVLGLICSGDTTYTLSAYVNTLGKVLSKPVLLGARDENNVGIPGAGVEDEAQTTDSSSHRDGWQRIWTTFTTPEGAKRVIPVINVGGAGGTADEFRLDAVQLEEGTYASPWTPGLLGPASILDKGGIAVDATRGGVFRLVGSQHVPGDRNVVELYQKGLRWGNDTELSSSSVGVLAVNGAPIALARTPIRKVYPPTGGNWTKPSAATGFLYAEVEVVGGGGGSGGVGATGAATRAASGGGGGGGYSKKIILAAALGATEVVTVGAGGLAGVAAAGDGGQGGTTSFGSHLSATGGFGGGGGTAVTNGTAAGGAGGTASGGDINAQGGPGGTAVMHTDLRIHVGFGGSSVLGGGAPSGSYGQNAIAGGPYGGGAGGGNSTASAAAKAGAAGGQGVVIVTEYYG